MADAGAFTPITEWGRWLHDLDQLSDAGLAGLDIAEINLQCAADLPGTNNSLLANCLTKVDDWAILVDRYTEYLFPHFRTDPDRFNDSQSEEYTRVLWN
ncbi:MAG: hypothetical protein FJ295_15710 [Planctomycetes bacterium]|nr:hypothetical protein [Planctomycetota bacterium]